MMSLNTDTTDKIKYFEKNYTYIDDINLVWGGGVWKLIHEQLIEKKNTTSIAEKCMCKRAWDRCWST